MARVPQARYLPNVDVVIIQFKCNPETVDPAIFNLQDAVLKASHTYDIQLGQSFDVQFVDHENQRLIARQSFIVTRAVEEMQTQPVDHYRTITKNVKVRAVEPLTDLMIYDHDDLPEDLRPEPKAAPAPAPVNQTPLSEPRPPKRSRKRLANMPEDYAKMDTGQLQKVKKRLTGKGFRPGTSKEEMVETLEGLEATAA